MEDVDWSNEHCIKLNIGQKNNVYLKLFSSTWQELDSVWARLYVKNIHTDILKENGTFTVRFRCNTELQIQKIRKDGKHSNEKRLLEQLFFSGSV